MFNWYEIIILFIFYAILGWIWEVILSFIQYNKFVNRGFLIGPYIPIYGFGGQIATVFFSSLANNQGILGIIITLISTSITCSILEYFTSFLMEKIFNNRWWDYSDRPLNINGRICLLFSLMFGAGCTITLKFINPIIRNIYDLMHLNNTGYLIIIIVFSIIIFTDTFISFSVISKLKQISSKIKEDSTEKITKEVRRIVIDKYNILYTRLFNSFPNMIIYNRNLLKKFPNFREFRKRFLNKKKSTN